MAGCESIDGAGRRYQGFTLVELMVTVAVIAIVAAIAAPSFSNLLLGSRLTAATNELTAALQGARLQAMRTNARVIVCPTTDGSTCSGSNWSSFVTISMRNGIATPLRTFALNKTGLSFVGSSNVATNNQIAYQADGFVRVGSATPTPQVGTIGVCAAALPGGNARNVQVSMGRIAVAKVANPGCSTTPANTWTNYQ